MKSTLWNIKLPYFQFDLCSRHNYFAGKGGFFLQTLKKKKQKIVKALSYRPVVLMGPLEAVTWILIK